MEAELRHQQIWGTLYKVVKPYFLHRFALESEVCSVPGPCIVIPNHVTNWDPFLVAMSFPDKQLYYVASEHIFRHKLASRALEWMLSPIARKKGDSGFSAAREILRRTKQGHSICLFAEGDCTWNGYSNHVLPATGKLVRSSGATLITYRLEGGYFTSPRWGHSIRRGKMRGRAVGVYGPQELRKMKGSEITALIDRDLYEDAWDRQKSTPVLYRSDNTAEYLETALYLCPVCHHIGTLRSKKKSLSCTACGFQTTFREDCLFHPNVPFETVGQWDQWQSEQLLKGNYEHGSVLFSDDVVSFRRILEHHQTMPLEGRRLIQWADRIRCGPYEFPLAEIDNMAMVKRNILLFTCRGNYYELRCAKRSNLRKYLLLWQNTEHKVSE